VVIDDLYIVGVGTGPAKAQTKLIVHANAPETGSITFQSLEPVRRRRPQILDAASQIQLLELSQCRPLDVRKSTNGTKLEKRLRVSTFEGSDSHGIRY
jgi:hypothetical protein